MLRVLAIAAVLLLPGYVCCGEPSSKVPAIHPAPTETSTSTKWKVAGGLTIGGVSVWGLFEKVVKTTTKVG